MRLDNHGQRADKVDTRVNAESAEAVLTHEAAIGRIAGDQLIKLMTLGLDEQEAVDKFWQDSCASSGGGVLLIFHCSRLMSK